MPALKQNCHPDRSGAEGPAVRPSAAPDFPLLCRSLDGLDRDKTAGPTTIDEVHPAGDLGIEGIVFSPADVQASLQLGAALAHDNRTACDYLAGEDLDAQSLSIGIATILRTA